MDLDIVVLSIVYNLLLILKILAFYILIITIIKGIILYFFDIKY